MWTFFPGALTIFANYNSNIFLINTREMWFSSRANLFTILLAKCVFFSGAFSNNISKFALKILHYFNHNTIGCSFKFILKVSMVNAPRIKHHGSAV
jgi:hypothetical protein